MIPIVVFASGRGSNFDAILKSVRERRLAAEIVGLVSDQARAPALDKAREAGIQAIHVAAPMGAAGLSLPERRAQHETKILEALAPLGARFAIMAGYMRVLTPKLIDAFRSERGYSRMVNIHPSLLPAFPGVHSYEQAYRHGAKVSGVTVHLVEPEVDSGPICAQEAFSIADCRSVAEVETRGLAIEHRLFSETLSWVLPERFHYEKSDSSGGRYHVRPY